MKPLKLLKRLELTYDDTRTLEAIGFKLRFLCKTFNNGNLYEIYA